MAELSKGTSRAILAVILLAGLAARIGWDFRQADASLDALPDQREYLELGDHLHTHQGLWFGDPRFGQTVYAFRTPGYPWLVALCGAEPGVIRIAQAGLDGLTIVAIYFLARRWLPRGAALVAAGLVAFDPFLIFFSGMILSETLFTCMLCWGILLLVMGEGPWPAGGGKLTAWLGGGFLLALAILVRPGAIALPILLGCGAALLNRRTQSAYSSKPPLPVAATMLFITGMVLFPWALRNRLTDGVKSWIWTSSNVGITRYDGFNPGATGASDQRFVQSMPWLADMTEAARSQYFSEKADDWMRHNPSGVVQLSVIKVLRTWSPFPLSDQFASRKMVVFVGLCFSGVLDLLVMVGLMRSQLPRGQKMFLLIPAIYFTVGAVLSVGSIRYRVPAEPVLAIIAANALAGWRGDGSAPQALPAARISTVDDVSDVS